MVRDKGVKGDVNLVRKQLDDFEEPPAPAPGMKAEQAPSHERSHFFSEPPKQEESGFFSKLFKRKKEAQPEQAPVEQPVVTSPEPKPEPVAVHEEPAQSHDSLHHLDALQKDMEERQAHHETHLQSLQTDLKKKEEEQRIREHEETTPEPLPSATELSKEIQEQRESVVGKDVPLQTPPSFYEEPDHEDHHEEKHEELKQQYDRLVEERHLFEEEEHELESERIHLKEEEDIVETKRGQLLQQEEQVSSLEGHLKEKEASLAAKEKAILEKEARVQQDKTNVHLMQEEISTTFDKLEEDKSIISEKSDAIHQEVGHLEELQAHLKAQEAKLGSLQASVEKREHEVEVTQTLLKDREKKLAEQEELVSEAKGHYSKKITELEKDKTFISDRESEISQTYEEMAAAKTSIEKQNKELDTKLTALDKKTFELDLKLQKLATKEAQLKKQEKQVTDKLKQAEQLKNLRQQIKSAEARYKRISERLTQGYSDFEQKRLGPRQKTVAKPARHIPLTRYAAREIDVSQPSLIREEDVKQIQSQIQSITTMINGGSYEDAEKELSQLTVRLSVLPEDPKKAELRYKVLELRNDIKLALM